MYILVTLNISGRQQVELRRKGRWRERWYVGNVTQLLALVFRQNPRKPEEGLSLFIVWQLLCSSLG